MRNRFVWLLVLVVAALVSEKCVQAQTPADSQCPDEHATWETAYRELRSGMDELARIKDEPIGPRIQNALENQNGRISIAQGIHRILKQRFGRISEASARCIDLAQTEKSAFERWRRCFGVDSRRRGPTSGVTPSSVAHQRGTLFAELQTLLLDEAYVQYKRDNPNPSVAAGYRTGPDTMAGYRPQAPDRRMGYGQYAPQYYQ